MARLRAASALADVWSSLRALMRASARSLAASARMASILGAQLGKVHQNGHLVAGHAGHAVAHSQLLRLTVHGGAELAGADGIHRRHMVGQNAHHAVQRGEHQRFAGAGVKVPANR